MPSALLGMLDLGGSLGLVGAGCGRPVSSQIYVYGREGLFYATSPELRGLLVAEHSEEAAWQAVPLAIQAMYEACGVRVIVIPAKSTHDVYRPWVAARVPALEAALAAESQRHLKKLRLARHKFARSNHNIYMIFPRYQ